MDVEINGQRYDYHDDESVRKACLRVAGDMVHMLPKRNTRQALIALLADVRFLFIKAQGLLFYHDAHSHKFMPLDDTRELVEYVRAILGEPPAENDSVITPAPELPPKEQPKVEIIIP